MLKRTITYTNPFTEKEVTEEHYFHISKSDLVEMEMEENKSTYTKDGETFTGMQAKLQKVVDSEDGKAIMVEFKDIIRRSYGKKDGDRFLKSQAIWEDFASSEAFSQFLFEVCTDADAASEFINGVIPNNMEQISAEVREKVEKAELAVKEANVQADVTKSQKDIRSPAAGPLAEERAAMGQTATTARVLTRTEAAEMDHKELSSGIADGRYKLS